MEDRQEAEAAIRARYTNPNTIRGAISEWARRRRANGDAPPAAAPRRGRTKDDMIDDYLKTTPLATIIARRKDLRRAERQQERAELERRLAQLDLGDREDEEEDVGDDDSTKASSTDSNDEVLATDDEIGKDDNDETQDEDEENTECDVCGEPGHRILPECRHLLCRQHFDEHLEDNSVECPLCSITNDL